MADITEIIKQFSEGPEDLFHNTKISKLDVIVETLRNADFNVADISEMSNFICKTIFKFSKKAATWKKKLYVCNGNIIKIVFTNGTHYVDEYGNCFTAEQEYLQTMSKFYGYNIFQKSYDNVLIECVFVSQNDAEYLEMLENMLERLNECFGFKNFLSDFKDRHSVAITTMRDIRVFFHFFESLNKLTPTRIYFSLVNDIMFIISPNLISYKIGINKIFHDFNNIETALKNMGIKKFTQSIDNVRDIVYSYKIMFTLYSWNNHINDQQINTRCTTESFKITCYLISSKILNFLRQMCPKFLMNLTLPELKYVVLWVAVKYRDETNAITSFVPYENEVKHEFYRLFIAAICSPKSKKHCFSNNFTATYHFSVHYTNIRSRLKLRERCPYLNNAFPQAQNFPELFQGNENACAPFYLEHLPDYIFDGDYWKRSDADKINVQKIKNYKKGNDECQKYFFKKYHIQGIQFNFVKKAFYGKGNTIRDREVGFKYGTFISTIYEVVTPVT